MAEYTVTEISEIVKGSIVGNSKLSVNSLLFDSRKSIEGSKAMFVAIAGERHDGHRHIKKMYQNGVKVFLISNGDIDFINYSDAAFIIVENTIDALQLLVTYHRSTFKIPIIGITGSNGKTIVKEWLSFCLSSTKNVIRSPKSYNSQIGVPLSVWLLNGKSEVGVFEAGISLPGEMNELEKIIRPTDGIITNIGEAHQEGFANIATKLKEKLKLFSNCETIYYCRDHERIHAAISENNALNYKHLFSWSTINRDSSLFIESLTTKGDFSNLEIIYLNKSHFLTIPFTDKASVENVVHVISYLLNNHYSLEQIQESVLKLQPVAMRMEQVKGINGCTLINDSYNSDINALSIALDFLKQQSAQKAVLILSDIQQTGLSTKNLYEKVNELILQSGVTKLIGIGEEISSGNSIFTVSEKEFYLSTKEFIESESWKLFNNENILIKGARGFQFESIINVLSEKNHTTVLESNLNNLISNLNYYRSLLKPETGIMVMVKALAYGSGSNEIANILQYEKIDYLGVAFTDEGVQLRDAGIHLPVMVMAPAQEDFVRIIQYNLEPEIYSFKVLQSFIKVAEAQQVVQYPVHIKIDTGMHRLGFLRSDINELLKILASTNTIHVKSVFSHLAASDEKKHDDFTAQQLKDFKGVAEVLNKELGYKPMRHILNSAGIERFPNSHFDMVRLGIGLHGVSVVHDNLLPVSALKSHIAQIKILPKGETVGYSRRGEVLKETRIAIIPIGYADGLDRKLGNGNGFVCIHGQRAHYIGSICMDMCMVDITEVNGEEGDEVIVFGQEPSIQELATLIDTIPYEILTNVSSRVKRVYLKD